MASKEIEPWAKTLLRDLAKLRERGETDVTLIARPNTDKDQDQLTTKKKTLFSLIKGGSSPSVENAMIKVEANRLVLRAASPYFEAMFSQMESGSSTDEERQTRWADGKTREVTIRGVDPQAFELLINIIYGDEQTLDKMKSPEQLIELIRAADMLQVMAIKEQAIAKLVTVAVPSNMCSIVEVVGMMDADRALGSPFNLVFHKFMDKFSEVAAYPDQCALMTYLNISALLNDGWKKYLTINESQVYTRLIDCWVLGKVTADGQRDPERLKHIPDIYKSLQFDNMDKNFLAETVAQRDKYLWEKDDACKELVWEAMRRHLLK